MNVAAVEVEQAYRRCEDATRQAAANFYYGIRLLPRAKRAAMSAVYAFARRVDDIGDDAGLALEERLAKLAAERRLVASLAASNGECSPDLADPVAIALAHAQRTFGLPLDALSMLIDGVELDVRGARYESFDELVVYCRDVAGSIGRLCLAIFWGSAGGPPAAEYALADDLGVAMQLTNILRDIREDRERGRVYLPAEDLRAFRCEDIEHSPPDRVASLIRFEATRAGEWFDRGLQLTERLDARSTSCVRAMTGIYRDVLARIARDPLEVMHARVSLSSWEKGWVALRSLAGAHAGELLHTGTAGGSG